jgi:hypothetical protein
VDGCIATSSMVVTSYRKPLSWAQLLILPCKTKSVARAGSLGFQTSLASGFGLVARYFSVLEKVSVSQPRDSARERRPLHVQQRFVVIIPLNPGLFMKMMEIRNYNPLLQVESGSNFASAMLLVLVYTSRWRICREAGWEDRCIPPTLSLLTNGSAGFQFSTAQR